MKIPIVITLGPGVLSEPLPLGEKPRLWLSLSTMTLVTEPLKAAPMQFLEAILVPRGHATWATNVSCHSRSCSH